MHSPSSVLKGVLGMFLMEAADPMTVLGTLFTTITGWISSIVSTIASSPLLLLPVGIFVVGAVIGLASRLIGR